MGKIYPIKKTFDGTPYFGVGGGAYHNTFSGITVLTADKDVKKPLFVRQNGHRANSHEQADVPIEIGDLIVIIQGNLPVDENNSCITITADQIVNVNVDHVLTEPAKINFIDLPVRIIYGLSRYHNKEGSFFVGDQ